MPNFHPQSSHWGAFSARLHNGTVEVRPHPSDPDPSPLLQNFTDTLHHRARIDRPHIRESWLRHGPAPADRTTGRLIPVSWDEALDRLAAELARVRDQHGPKSVFGGSYGWSSAGRFHHAQSQVHRFLNTALGGYVRSVNSYSAGASAVILPHIFGPGTAAQKRNVTWAQITAHTDTVVAFGGLPLRNMAVAAGGVSRHIERQALRDATARGCRFINISPLRSDLDGGEWLPITPGTDTALILALLHTLVREGLHDASFLQTHCTGWDTLQAHVLGHTDTQPKNPAWAADITGIPAPTIEALARRMAAGRTLVGVAHALQRAEHGEQPVWAAAALAAALGQIGLPGGGFTYALGTLAHYGRQDLAVPIPTLSQGTNGIDAFIPCARIADMLLHPGEPFDYNGRRLTYPDIRLLYWAGGNPFHHHQDLNRLRRAFARPETIVVHDSAWTATARHADIVLPCTTTLERMDLGASTNDPLLVAMHPIAPPFAQARDDHAIFAALARRLGTEHAFTEGRDVPAWLKHLYEPTRKALQAQGHEAPTFDELWGSGETLLPEAPDDGGALRAFRHDPAAHPLPTPSGKIELASATIAGFNYQDCPGHPAWLPPADAPTPEHPLHLVANQPATRLHSQLDFGAHSQQNKRQGREVLAIHPQDATPRNIANNTPVRVSNARGWVLAVARLTNEIMPGTVQLPTGAWYDPEGEGCTHGNPNLLTRDAGTSSLAQGCTGQLTAVQVTRFEGNLPPIRAYNPPG